MSFWSRISPRRALGDFADQWRQPTPHRWQILGIACATTFAILFFAMPDSQRIPPAKPDVTYITTFTPDRSREEIVASNLVNQERKDRLAALVAERQEQRKEAFRALGRATFLDVDALEKQYADDAAPAAQPSPPAAAAPAAPQASPAAPGAR